MSWEVWTMPQKTSFCNRTLLRSDLRHFWPAGFVYVLIWLMILPIQLLRAGYDAPRGDGLLAENLEPLLHNVIVGASVGSLVLAVVCGVVIPMAVYAYLMTPRSVGMMHALPVKRTTQYFSHFLAGFGLLTAGNLLIFLLSVLAQLPFGMVDWSALGQWLLLTELLELFFLSLGALCAMVTGWLLAIPVLYVAVNFAALLLCSVVQFLQRWFYFGFQYTTYPPFVQWLTPIIKLAEAVGFLDGEYITRNGIEVYWRSLSAQALPTSAIYAAAGLALLALGWLLYRKRPSETAGDAIAFPWLRILVRWAVGLCGGLGLGLFLSSFVLGGSRSLAKLLLCQVFMGLLCFVAAQMLLQNGQHGLQQGAEIIILSRTADLCPPEVLAAAAVRCPRAAFQQQPGMEKDLGPRLFLAHPAGMAKMSPSPGVGHIADRGVDAHVGLADAEADEDQVVAFVLRLFVQFQGVAPGREAGLQLCGHIPEQQVVLGHAFHAGAGHIDGTGAVGLGTAQGIHAHAVLGSAGAQPGQEQQTEQNQGAGAGTDHGAPSRDRLRLREGRQMQRTGRDVSQGNKGPGPCLADIGNAAPG